MASSNAAKTLYLVHLPAGKAVVDRDLVADYASVAANSARLEKLVADGLGMRARFLQGAEQQETTADN